MMPFRPEIVRCIPGRVDPGQLERDLHYLRDKALAAGAGDCTVVGGDVIAWNPDIPAQMAADHRLPSIHWPLDYPRDDLREAMDCYQWAVFFQLPMDNTVPDYGGGPITDPAHRRRYIQTYEIVTVIESAAFYMGYHLALGLASGNCRSVFCPDEKRCQAALKGHTCIRPNIGRPSMEAAGIDARAMAKAIDWELPAESAPFLGGLVMIH